MYGTYSVGGVFVRANIMFWKHVQHVFFVFLIMTFFCQHVHFFYHDCFYFGVIILILIYHLAFNFKETNLFHLWECVCFWVCFLHFDLNLWRRALFHLIISPREATWRLIYNQLLTKNPVQGRLLPPPEEGKTGKTRSVHDKAQPGPR